LGFLNQNLLLDVRTDRAWKGVENKGMGTKVLIGL